jgi:LysR family transcriptional activator of nhaA
MKPWINYHHLNYFKVIATEGSISKAAQKLRLGQPTLSAQLKQFEETIGVALFERHHKKLVLTEAGQMTLQYANEIFRLGGELVEVLHDDLDQRKINVQLGALDSIPKHLILQITEAARKYGECSVSILEGKPDEMLRLLRLHQVDLFITDSLPSGNEATGIFSSKIARVPVSLYAAPKFKKYKNNFPDSLAKAPFVLPTRDSKLRHDLDDFFRLQKLSIDIVAETQDMSLQKLMGTSGMGIVPIPLIAADGFVKNGQLVEIGRPAGFFVDYYLVATSRKIENPISMRLLKEFRL